MSILQANETLSLINGVRDGSGSTFYQAICTIAGNCSSYACCDWDDCVTAYNPDTGETIPRSEAPSDCEADNWGDGVEPCPCCTGDYIVTGEHGCRCSGGYWSVPAYQYIGYSWGWSYANAYYGIDDCVMECDMATDGRDLAGCYLNCAEMFLNTAVTQMMAVEIHPTTMKSPLLAPGTAVAYLNRNSFPDGTTSVSRQFEEITLDNGSTATRAKTGTATGIRKIDGYLGRNG